MRSPAVAHPEDPAFSLQKERRHLNIIQRGPSFSEFVPAPPPTGALSAQSYPFATRSKIPRTTSQSRSPLSCPFFSSDAPFASQSRSASLPCDLPAAVPVIPLLTAILTAALPLHTVPVKNPSLLSFSFARNVAAPEGPEEGRYVEGASGEGAKRTMFSGRKRHGSEGSAAGRGSTRAVDSFSAADPTGSGHSGVRTSNAG